MTGALFLINGIVMGVERDFYIIYGYEIPFSVASDLYDDVFDEGYNAELEDKLDTWVVMDGMSGEYACIGKKIFHATQYKDEGLNVLELPDNIEEIDDIYFDLVGLEPIGNPKVIAIDHKC